MEYSKIHKEYEPHLDPVEYMKEWLKDYENTDEKVKPTLIYHIKMKNNTLTEDDKIKWKELDPTIYSLFEYFNFSLDAIRNSKKTSPTETQSALSS